MFESDLSNFELCAQKCPWHRGPETSKITSCAQAGQVQSGQHPGHHQRQSVIVQALLFWGRNPSRPLGAFAKRQPWWKPLLLAAGCWQAEWLPGPCQAVILQSSSRHPGQPTKRVQGQWKELASKFQESHGVDSEASLPSPTPLEAQAAWKRRVWRESRLNNSVIRTTSLFCFLPIMTFQRDESKAPKALVQVYRTVTW